MSDEETDQILVNGIAKEEKKKFARGTDSMSAKLRQIIETHNKITDSEYEIKDDFEYLSLVALKTYKNAIEQNIQLMENQKEKLENEIEKFEKEDEDNEILLEIDLDIESKNV